MILYGTILNSPIFDHSWSESHKLQSLYVIPLPFVFSYSYDDGRSQRKLLTYSNVDCRHERNFSSRSFYFFSLFRMPDILISLLSVFFRHRITYSRWSLLLSVVANRCKKLSTSRRLCNINIIPVLLVFIFRNIIIRMRILLKYIVDLKLIYIYFLSPDQFLI